MRKTLSCYLRPYNPVSIWKRINLFIFLLTVVQCFPVLSQPNAPSLSFEGISHINNLAATGFQLLPPYTTGEVGPSHYVQAVASSYMIWDKSGTPLTAPRSLNSLFDSAGVGCTNIIGTPVVLYDQLADRWLLIMHCSTFTPVQRILIAVSKSGDPAGAYHCYSFPMPFNKYYDTPKFGVWHDGYYMTSTIYDQAATVFLGSAVVAFDRLKMIAGDNSAGFVYFDNVTIEPFLSGLLPSDLDGLVPPPAGAPNTFACFTAMEFGQPFDALRLFDFHADFEEPSNSTFHERPGSPLLVSPFDPVNPPGRFDIPQPAPSSPTTMLDANGDGLMFRLAYRNLGSSESLVANHTVNASVFPDYRAGVRFYELTRPLLLSPYVIKEQQTFAPVTDIHDRWLGSGAINHQGDVAIGYSISGFTQHPSIRYAARLGTDPAGAGLAQGEQLVINGTGVQMSTTGRWGNHSHMSVDPTDDCSFWYTNEYYVTISEAGNSLSPWHTRIAKFAPGNCSASARGTFQGMITDCETGLPIENALVDIDGYARITDLSGSFNGFIAAGSYSPYITAENYSEYNSIINVDDGDIITLNTCLVALPLLAIDSIIIGSDLCNNDNHIDPFEDVTIDVRLFNAGIATSAPVTVTLLDTGTISDVTSQQVYDSIAPGNSLLRTFSFNAGNIPCGSLLELSFVLMMDTVLIDTVNYSVTTGTINPEVLSYSSGNIAVPIPDNSFTDIEIVVTDSVAIADVNVGLRINHTFTGDLEIELIHPDNSSVILVNNRGGAGDNFGTGTLDCGGTKTVFDDQAAVNASTGVAPFSGSYKPEFPLSAFNGKPANGIWKLRVKDQATLDVGSVGCVTFDIQAYNCCQPGVNYESLTLIAESCAPGNGAIDPGETTTFSLCLRNSGPLSGNVEGVLLSNANVFSNGIPILFGEIEADSLACSSFSFFAFGSCGEEISTSIVLYEDGNLLDTLHHVFVMGQQTISDSTFENPASIALPMVGFTSGAASVYPSTINVSGLQGTITNVSVTLTGLTHSFPGDLDMLLLGPEGQKIIFMSDIGEGTDINQINITFDDEAANLPPATLQTGTFRPQDLGTGDAFPSPAPGGPYASTFEIFDGTNPNGTWYLYIIDDAAIDVGNLDGWSLSITTSEFECCDDSCSPLITLPSGPVTFCETDTLQLETQCVIYAFNGNLSGVEEVPPNFSAATGDFSGTFNTITNELTIDVNFFNLSGPSTNAHIHNAPQFVNGPVIIPFNDVFTFGVTSGSFSKTTVLTPAHAAALLDGNTYVNVHSVSIPGGEIRGQIQLQEQCDELDFVWSTGDTTASVSVTESGIYIVTATDAQGCTTVAGVHAVRETYVTVNAGSDQEVCEENSVSLNGSWGGGATSATWSTSGSGTFIPNDSDPNVTYQPSPADVLNGSVEIYYSVNDPDVCGIVSDTMMVTLTQLSAPAQIMNGPELICNPASGVTFNYTVLPVAGVVEYNWTTTNPNIIILGGQGSTGITVTFNPSALHLGITGEICVTTSNGGSCNNSIPLCKEISVQISAPVTPGSISGPAKACPNDTATYSIAFVSRAASYNWIAPAGASIVSGQGELVVQVAYSPAFTGGTLSVTAANGCGQSPARSRTVALNVLNAPGIISGPSAGLCELQDVVYSVNPVPGALYYQWTIPSGATIDGPSDQSSIALDFDNTITSGSLICRAVNNCGPGSARSMILKGAPAATGTITGLKTVCTLGTYPYSVTTVQGATNYIWTAPGTIINQGSKDILVQFGGPATNQIITVKAANSCGISPVRILNAITIQFCVREGENAFNDLNADPNPAKDLLFVKFTSDSETDYVMSLTDVAGRIIYTESYSASEGLNNVSINLNGFAQGMYLLNLQSGHWSDQLRIVVE